MTLKTLLFLLVCNFGWAQNYQTAKVIINDQTKLPLEYVNVYNSTDNTVSNADGSFIFKSSENIINISAIGYKSLSTSFDRINKSDTIFLKSNRIELEELVITNTTSLLNDVYRNVAKNYPTSTYQERFFLRCIVKKNDEVRRLQDIFGKIERNTLFRNENITKTNYKAEILNMRKVDLTEKSTVEYFSLYSLEMLYSWFTSIFLNSKDYNFRSSPINDDNYYKIEYSISDKFKDDFSQSGYYLINKGDKAIKEVRYTMITLDKAPYMSKKQFKWRANETQLFVNFRKDEKTSKYYISNAKLSYVTEVINETTNEKDIYEVEYDLLTTESFIKDKIKSNFSVEKDLFKANFLYSEDFWKNQNQLLLTNELEEFLK